MTFEEKIKLIEKGVEEIIPRADLIAKMKESEKTGRPLRVKYGIDPTGHEVHIGHLVPIRKMREFQDLGHTGVIIIGDFTARIGDPTGRDESRPPLSAEQVKQNAANYMDQLYKVLAPARTEVRWQSEWFGPMGLDDVLKMLGKFTLAQFLAHDTFRNRFEQGLPLGMHEIMYPVLQAYDSVAIQADIELGATEQKFNILCGRDMLRYHGMPAQGAVLSPILLGTDGVQKMSKSLGNYIAVFDPPAEKYGKVMSIPDSSIVNYFTYATTLPVDEIAAVKRELESGQVTPKHIKMRLAREIVALYDGAEAAQAAEAEFERVFARGDLPDDMPELLISEPVWIVKALTDGGVCATGGEARRMIAQGAVRLDDDKLTDADAVLDVTGEAVLKVGKRRFLRIKRV